jgi:hypothetical protein
VRRFHLFEFTDLPWWPDTFRSLLTGFLHRILEAAQPFTPKVDLVARALDLAGRRRIVDLCSGGVGPWLHLKALLEQSGGPVEVVLTDKYPDAEVARAVEGIPGFSYCREPIDALDVPEGIDGVRTLVDCLHHFPPAQAQGILADAVRRRQPIVVFEALERSVPALLPLILLPLFILVLTPTVRPFTFSRLFFTYLVPVALVVVPWDVMVSILRCYTPAELLALGQAAGPDYEWQAGTYKKGGSPVTYLAGYPR